MEKRFELAKLGLYLQDLANYRLNTLNSENFFTASRLAARFTQIGICTFKDGDGVYYITEKELQRIPNKLRAYAKTLKKQTRVRGRYNYLIAAWENIIVPDMVKLLEFYKLCAEEDNKVVEIAA